MKLKTLISSVLLAILLLPYGVKGQEFKKWEAKTAEFKRWLDQAGAQGSRLWMRLDSKSRPQRVYVGEGFYKADDQTRKHFVEIFSHCLAGHPEKFMLIDLFDAKTGAQIGEFGWGGYKLFSNKKLVSVEAKPASAAELKPASVPKQDK